MFTEIFKDDNSNKTFFERGFLKYGHLNQDLVSRLIALSDKLDIPDYNGCDYNCGMNSDIYDKRKQMHDGIIALIADQITNLLVNFKTYSATFVNKNPNDNCFVHAHQDFTFSNEPDIPSLMCWIPLVDVDINNGAMGLIPKSHTFYNHIRAFPFPFAKTSITENEIKLMPYFEIVDMKAGELLFFMNSAIHGSFGNYSNTCRYAITINFYKKNEKILAYIHNPKTNGKTMLKFEVAEHFIVDNNNLLIQEMYNNGTINVNLPLMEEIPFVTEEVSWENIEHKLKSNLLEPNPLYLKLVEEYLSFQNKKKNKPSFYELFSRTYQKYFK
jgi:hypothetical protein